METGSLYETLAKLSLLLNAHHDQQAVISDALKHISSIIECEAATLFLLNDRKTELEFWASEGGAGDALVGKSMPVRGIVGWVVENKEAAIVHNPKEDPRFFKDIDSETSFQTKNLMCVPLMVRGGEVIGALEVLNATDTDGFTQQELQALELFGSVTALAVDNAKLVSALQAETVKLQELNRKKEDVLDIIAHEFRTPLNVIQMSAELLQHHMVKTPADEERIFQSLLRAVNTLTKRVVEVRDVSITSRNQMQLEYEQADLVLIVRQISGMYAPLAAERLISYAEDLPDTELLTRCDKTLVLLAIAHLMRNAIRFTPDKGAITLSLKRESGFAKIVVQDSGIGIAKEQQKAIFEKFFESTSIMQHSSGDLVFRSAGLGLGLSTARSIARAHQGDLVVQSELGKGSKFTLSLPIVAVGK